MKHIDQLKAAYANPRNDFLLLDGTGDTDALCLFLDSMNMGRMKCYSLSDTPPNQLRNYFNYLYQACKETEILE